MSHFDLKNNYHPEHPKKQYKHILFHKKENYISDKKLNKLISLKMRKCIEENCNEPVFGTDKITRKGYCKRHQYKRTDQKNTLKSSYEPTGEGLLFQGLFRTRRHISWLTGLKIDNISHMNCAHVVNKGNATYSKLCRLDIDNIIFLTFEEHSLLDRGTKDQRNTYQERCRKSNIPCNWNRIEELRAELINKYKMLLEDENK